MLTRPPTSPGRLGVPGASLVLLGFIGLMAPGTTFAHDQWADGSSIPAWVKSSCCGAADAHHLRPDQVHDMGDYYLVDGYHDHISKKAAIPSQDGDYWIFYANYPAGDSCAYTPGASGGMCAHHEASQSGVYCFFVPMNF